MRYLQPLARFIQILSLFIERIKQKEKKCLQNCIWHTQKSVYELFSSLFSLSTQEKRISFLFPLLRYFLPVTYHHVSCISPFSSLFLRDLCIWRLFNNVPRFLLFISSSFHHLTSTFSSTGRFFMMLLLADYQSKME